MWVEHALLWTEGMPILFRLACLGFLTFVASGPQDREVTLQNGDVVLMASRSSRAPIIERASRSPYSHVGLVEVTQQGVFVIEAIQPVSRTPFEKFKARAEDGKVTVLRANDLDAKTLAKVVGAAKKELGKPYDARYRWDDESLYCSELVVKAFERGAGISVGKKERVRDLALTKAELAIAKKLGIDPEQELVTPGSLANDDHLSPLPGTARGQGE